MRPFYERLRIYFDKVQQVLLGQASAASVFANPADIGQSRERIYAEFLKSHLPSSCSVVLGGFLFNLEGAESGQLDVIVLSDASPQFNIVSSDDQGKAFACVEGALAVVSIKSTLSPAELGSALSNLASIPDKAPIEGRISPIIKLPEYDDWPLKIIYASAGPEREALFSALQAFYQDNPDIPLTKRPNLIHVASKYCVVRVGQGGGSTRDGTKIPPNEFHSFDDQSGAYGLAYSIVTIQEHALASRHIIFKYGQIIDKMPF